jgi:UDP-3-O-acyl N-acetylglucosamine deacetylase
MNPPLDHANTASTLLPPMTASEERQSGGPVRRTPRQAASVQGLGLFTGAPSRVTIRPAAMGTGIRFHRTDLAATRPGRQVPSVLAAIGNVVSEQRRTVLQADRADGEGCRVETVEHILSALAGLGITDAHIDVDGPEIPIGDGSSLPFERALTAGGTEVVGGLESAPARISQPLAVSEKGGQIDVLPGVPGAEGCEYIYRLDYGPGSPIPPQEARFFLPRAGDVGGYAERVAPARTFSTLAEAQAMRRMGLFTQFTPRDLLVIAPYGPIDNTLRFANEPAMHKLLDMVGDLSLAGRPIIGRVVASRSGHALNHEMARALAALP